MELGAIPANNATAPFLAHKQVPVEYTIGKTSTLLLLFGLQLRDKEPQLKFQGKIAWKKN